jgi:SAM-dependent methyltransferase
VICPVCGNRYRLLRSAVDLEREASIRQRFVTSRFGRAPVGLEAMDLTHFMHADPAEVLACTVCGTLRRWNEPPVAYESDQYDLTLLRHLYPRYRRAFERKRSWYQGLLPSHAEVLEVGSHVGSFLEVAEWWGWKPIGLDIGTETSDFARRQGATVRQLALEDYSRLFSPLDAVFIWNCFEQLEDPRQTLAEVRRILSPHGVVVLRVPNAAFYRRQISRGPAASLLSLGYNNLLGFPYLNGYSPASLHRLLQSMNFEPVATFASSLLTPPYPEMNRSLRDEWRTVRMQAERSGAAESPWIEVVGRSV